MSDVGIQLPKEGSPEEQETLRKLQELELTCKTKEAEDFIERVEEVHETIRGLIDGTIDPAALERHEERERWRARAKEIRKEVKDSLLWSYEKRGGSAPGDES